MMHWIRPAFFAGMILLFLPVAHGKYPVLFGPRDSGGGDEIGIEFQALLRNSILTIQRDETGSFREIAGLDWEALLSKTTVLVVEMPLRVIWKGQPQESVATNEPSTHTIRINRNRWSAIESRPVKEGIALHEALSLLGLERTGSYLYSGRYLALYGLDPETLPEQVGGRENPVSDNPFLFRFAYREPHGTTPGLVFLPGEAATESALIRTCGQSGSACTCEFQDEGGIPLGETSPEEISYHKQGNFLVCAYSGASGSLARVKVKSRKRRQSSRPLPVQTWLNPVELLGDQLDLNRLRTVYRYSCTHTFLQKEGTSEVSFDCSSQVTTCGSGAGRPGNFCLLKTDLPYFLYASNYESNFMQKGGERLYNEGGTGQICGLQIHRLQCGGTGGLPQARFGLYGEKVGIWEIPVSLPPAPDAPLSFQGYAARTIPFQGQSICPFGLEKSSLYESVIQADQLRPSSNFPGWLNAIEVSGVQRRPGEVSINIVEGGNCDGTRCTRPDTFGGSVATFPHVKVNQTDFCVLPAALLQTVSF